MGPLGARAGPGEWPPSIFLLNAALAVAGMGAGLLAAGLGRWGLRWLFVVDTLTCLLCALTVHHALLEQQLAVGRTVFVDSTNVEAHMRAQLIERAWRQLPFRGHGRDLSLICAGSQISWRNLTVDVG